MALDRSDASIRIPRGYECRTRYYQEISDGIRPALELLPVEYLPVVLVDQKHNWPKVILAGAIVANSTWPPTAHNLTFANGGTAMPIVYAAQDVYVAGNSATYAVENIDNVGTLVAAAGAANTPDPANLPIGYASNDYYSEAMRAIRLNDLLQDHVAIVCDQFIEIAIHTAHQQTGNRALINGCLVVPDPGAAGVSVRYLAADSVEQIIGRVIRVEAVQARGGLERVFTTRGLGLPGNATGGIESHLNHAGVTHSAKINITLA